MNNAKRAQSSFELLVTLSVGLAILLPLIIIAFVQLAGVSASLSAIEAQQAASKLANVATLVGSEGPPATELVQIQIPPNVRSAYVGNLTNGVGHEIVFVINAQNGASYITVYTPVNVSGNIGGIVSAGTYLINVTATSACPNNLAVQCVYISPSV